MNISKLTILAPLLMLGLVATTSYAEVIPAPNHPGHHNIAANNSNEHQQASKHHKDSADYFHAMTAHHESLAREHKKLGQHKLAEHHEKLAKLTKSLAEEHHATAKTHEDHGATK